MNIDKGEDLMGTIRDQMHGQNIAAMSIRVGVSKSALYNLRSGKTLGPRNLVNTPSHRKHHGGR